VSKRVRVRADLGSIFPFGPALRPNSHGAALFKLGQEKVGLTFSPTTKIFFPENSSRR